MQKNVVEYLINSCERVPDKLSFVDSSESLNYSELNRRSQAIASYLLSKNLSKARIGIWINRSNKVLCAYFGAMYSNNCYIPLDFDMGNTRIESVISDTKPDLIIADRASIEAIDEFKLDVEIAIYEDIENFEIDESAIERALNSQIDIDPIYITYTSGSSGKPKLVIVNHRSVIDYIDNLGLALGFSENTVFANQSPLYIDACLKDIYSSVKYGATDYIVPKELFMFPVKLVEYLNDNKINTICWVVSALSIISQLKALEKSVPKYIHTIAFGGEKFPAKQLNIWLEKMPNTKFFNLYGPTEATGMSVYYELKMGELNQVLYIGKPFRNTEILLVKNDGKRACTGEEGEIYIRGTCVTLGYFKDSEKTDEAFVQNPLHNDYRDIVYKTGDSGVMNENGDISFVGRNDNQIKHMGYRIELLEIEAQVGLVDGIERASCLYDDEKSRIYLFYVGNISESDLKIKLTERLARYMVPQRIVKLDEFPITNSGKVDKQNLKERM